MTEANKPEPRMYFDMIITSLDEPAASFYDAKDPGRRNKLNFNKASLETTIVNEEANAKRYPHGNARATLAQLYAARGALGTYIR